MTEKILIVEDDLDLHFILGKILKKSNYEIQSAYSGQVAQSLIDQNQYDLIILDLMLPEVTGEQLIKYVRDKRTIPILVISAKGQVEDRVLALDNGADDYLVKPFIQSEVLARVRALMRRYKQFSQHQLEPERVTFKSLTLHIEAHKCFFNSTEVILTSKEFQLLSLFLRYPNKVFTKEQLYKKIWENPYLVEDNAINVHISNIRKKLKQFNDQQEYIETVWGIGFKLKGE